jgi:polyphenol oxidase
MLSASMLQTTDVIVPDWPAPKGVKAFFTTRSGGVSTDAYASLNLGAHVGDDHARVEENRRRLRALLSAAPVWLNQVHGVDVLRADVHLAGSAATADASVASQREVACAVLVADCLPVLLCTADGSCVGAAHAGWRGLQAGVLERTVEAMDADSAQVLAWLGPAIGPNAFEVGADVFDAFTNASSEDTLAFRPIAGRPGKYFADIYALARARLQRAGVQRIYGGGFCTVSEPLRFFSYRRDGATGRMAAVIWRE